MFDWGDGTNSGWVGPYNSGQTASASHTWLIKGTYQIRVKAKDTTDLESPWSETLSITIPRDRSYNNYRFFNFINRLSELIPIIKILIN